MENRASILIDHYRKPCCRGVIPDAVLRHEIHNRKCGDRLSFTLTLEDQTLRDIRFEGAGCFYCIASASILCSTLSGENKQAALDDIERFRTWLADPGSDALPAASGAESALERNLEEISALGEVKAYPMRIGCVDLAWKGVKEMLSRPDAG